MARLVQPGEDSEEVTDLTVVNERDGEPCADCRTWLPFTEQAAAIDCGTVCVPCGTKRYGDRLSEYLICDAPVPA